MHAYRHCGQKQFQEASHASAFGWRTPGLKLITITKDIKIKIDC